MKNAIQLFFFLSILSGVSQNVNAQVSPALYQSDQYSIFADRVIQENKYEAKAISSTEIISNYKSLSNQFQSTQIAFKFSINGKDNEMAPGVDHHINIINGIQYTPVIKFGEPLKDNTAETNTFLLPDTRFNIKVDMNAVLDAFKTKGYFTTFKGDKIYKEDFKGLFVAGNTLPMIWDFDNLHTKEGLELKDADGDGIYETTLIINAQKDEKQTAAQWKLTKDISAFPTYTSPYLITDALYNMSTEEMIKAVEPDSTFRTGKEWAGVWTRDISYSIILSMAYLQPAVAMNSLMRKVNSKKKIIQDTGTGGAYPCSTDRMVWAVAAWEIYKATGDKDWLQQAFVIIKNSVNDDMLNAYDKLTGMVRGESSFLDWREQTYPKWMQPADIFESENLATNAVHYQANIVLAQMAKILKQPAAAVKYAANAQKIKLGINRYLWLQDKGYYAQYLFGRNFKSVSPRSEVLGEALCVLFNIADKKTAAIVVAKTPVTAFGISCIYPQIPNIPPYHNNAVWPFVQSYWAMASAKAGNEKSVMESLCAIWRPAALFLTNKENFVADNGDFAGTVINSSNMLWSLSGSLAMMHKVIFGIEFMEDKLSFHPFVPAALKGARSLTNFKYRNAVLDIQMEGFGNTIKSFLLDGKLQQVPEIPTGLKGKHFIKIELANMFLDDGKINKQHNYTAPATPLISNKGNTISWQKIEGVKNFKLFKNGKYILTTFENNSNCTNEMPAEYQLIAVDGNGVESFASEPLLIEGKSKTKFYEMERFAAKSNLNYKGAIGDFVEISHTINKQINIPIEIKEPGLYAINFRYANGNGPVNTENKCAIRTILVDKKFAGTVVFPQRGKEEWSNWGFSNAIQMPLQTGKHTITISFTAANENMNGLINQAMLDQLQIVQIK